MKLLQEMKFGDMEVVGIEQITSLLHYFFNCLKDAVWAFTI